ncbi:trypsin domain-containing protein [Phthorimaea operculella]|nr:trypsin domain-containing protein [Phthorimaea operculella]
MNALTIVLLAGACLASAAGNRIVGGELTTINEYPGIVAIENLSWLTETWAQSCAGNILTTRWIVSAAHCFEGFWLTETWAQSCAGNILTVRWIVSAAHCFEGLFYEPRRRRIRAGSSFRNTGGQVIGVVSEFKHPTYGSYGMDGDINVILLQSPLEYNPVVAAVNIVSQGFELPDDSPVVHAGWGTTSSGGTLSEQLRDVTIYTINRELCRDRYWNEPPVGARPVTENMICAGILDVGGKDACQGDSGGPLYYTDAVGTRILVGIVSWGLGCANATFGGLSTRVSSYTDWIIETAV